MRILQLTNKVPYPPRDGGAIASLSLATGLARAGHEVVVLAMNTTKHRTVGETQSINLISVPVDTRIRWFPALMNLLFSRLPYNAVRFRSREYAAALRRLLEKEKFDFVLLENLYTFLYLDILESFQGTRIIMRSHNIEHEIWLRTAKATPGLKGMYLKILGSRIRRFELKQINRYSAVVPISEHDGAQLTAFGNHKPMFILPTGIELSSKELKPQPGIGSLVGHLGALDWLPNQNGIRWFLQEVWPIVKKSIPKAEFHLAGRNSPKDFAAEMQAMGAFFHGEIEDAQSFTAGLSVMVIPLFSGSGMRIKMLDYLSEGKAVVSTTIGAEGVCLTPGTESLVADRPVDFAAAVITLLRSPGLRKEMGEKAIELVRNNYSNDLLIKRFVDFLTRLP
ncbi:MAG TPA: hypothetical protein DC042_13090 [Bacteroidales bacterium]|nr:hypothetical protein [Bacteroidales bacterium]